MKIDSPLGPAWNKKECFESAHDFTGLHIHLEWTLAAQSTFFEARFDDIRFKRKLSRPTLWTTPTTQSQSCATTMKPRIAE
jgi:hypothetical protein